MVLKSVPKPGTKQHAVISDSCILHLLLSTSKCYQQVVLTIFAIEIEITIFDQD